LLSVFVTEHSAEIAARCSAKAAARGAQTAPDVTRGIPLFLDQLVEILRSKQHGEVAVTKVATAHGAELLRRGFTIGQVVHDYGDVCQTITGLASEHGYPIGADEFQLLNLCLDDAIAGAATEYGRQRELDVAAAARDRSTQDLGILSYEVGNLVWSAALAFDALKTGSVGITGSTGAVVSRSLANLRSLVERSFAVMKLKGQGGTRGPIAVGDLIAAVELGVTAETTTRGTSLAIEIHDADAIVEADLRILAPMVAQLVQNACDHTSALGHVVLRSSATTDRVRIEIEDECGGLPPGAKAMLLRPLAAEGSERSGLGLDLQLIRSGIEDLGGTIQARDLPGKGCMFTLELPRSSTTQ
jgi:signal transduction histidine kinase